jgi:hypothetical protein
MRLAIVGGGNTMLRAPYADMTYDIWTTASIAKDLPRVSRIFEFHDSDARQPEAVYEKATDVMYRDDFPVHELEKKYGKIFPSSMNLILAYGMELGYKHITLYGVDMAQDSEYARFRPSFLYLVGYARGAGVTVEISEGSALMAPERTYCYEYDIVRERIQKIERDMAYYKTLAHDAELKAEYLRGARDSADFFSKI